MRAVIYARYSSDNQREESIDGQLRECKKFAEYNGITIVGEYIDRAFSAKTDNRPEFQHMIKDSYKNTFDIVIVWKLDRFARNRYDSARYKALLKKNGVKVVSATEKIAEDASGILLESLLEGYAEFYSAELAEKVKRGMTDNALKAKTNGVRAPMGYYVDDTDHYQIDQTFAPIVKEIFALYVDGKKVTDIVKIMAERGIKNRNYPLNYNSIYRILTNRKYIGEYKFGDVLIVDGIPALIDTETFEMVQRRMATNKKAPAMHRTEDDYLLTTKLFCGHCGAMMIGEIGTSQTLKKYRYYRCSRSKKGKCDKKSIAKDYIENLVIDNILEVLSNNQILEELAKRIYDMQAEQSFTIASLKNQLEEVDKKLDNIVEAITRGIYSSKTKQMLDELEEQKVILQTKLNQEEFDHPIVSEEQILHALYHYKNLDTSTKEGKQRLIDGFVNSIYLYDDRYVITFNYKNKSKTVTFEEIESSSLTSKASPKRKRQVSTCLFSFCVLREKRTHRVRLAEQTLFANATERKRSILVGVTIF
ncbi:MAG: recombinase family protein [Clostridia bacterium]|nr:recombinase family protein [Clostridia bacterium]